MDFTREPIVETIITPRAGFRLVIRSSKNLGQEEFSVDSLEVISFGSICFYRHLERPRSFMVPASDYEVFEIREVRMPLKAASFEGVVKPNVVKESHRAHQKGIVSKDVSDVEQEHGGVEKPLEEEVEETPFASAEIKHDKRKDKKRSSRRKRSLREEGEEIKQQERAFVQPVVEEPPPIVEISKEPLSLRPTVLPPPQTLIRDDLDRLRKSEQYQGAFYVREERVVVKEEKEDLSVISPHLKQEETPPQQEEENVYKATPLPEEEDVKSPLWVTGTSLGGEK